MLPARPLAAPEAPSPRVRGSLRAHGVYWTAPEAPSPRVRGSLRHPTRRLQDCRIGPSPRVRGSLCHIIDGYPSIQLSKSSSVLSDGDHNLLTRSTPSASRISFSGSPRCRSAKPPAPVPSRQSITTAPFPSAVNQSSSTPQTRSRTPDERSVPCRNALRPRRQRPAPCRAWRADGARRG